mmetsp:Transcript_78671/g.227403  ORF Transcript_78671/g.227403 Transcript_78671/m.227403 type:complete len:105 (-) Transcript_78671:129-443(-)
MSRAACLSQEGGSFSKSEIPSRMAKVGERSAFPVSQSHATKTVCMGAKHRRWLVRVEARRDRSASRGAFSRMSTPEAEGPSPAAAAEAAVGDARSTGRSVLVHL